MRWRRPLDWTRGAGRPRAVPPSQVDVIVPVYGAAAELDRCLASVFAHTRQRVTVVLDGPQDEAVNAVIARHPVCILRNETREGFASAANRGMRAAAGDVVLLNSDTVVTPRWLEKLIEAAYSSGDVGTVTPLSNHATLCSVPRAFASNLIPSGYDADSFAAHVEAVSAREYPRIPTAVGFCMYIRRALLDDIGELDAAAFAEGYGEENDFCMRALARGWIHIADDATFIEHAGHRSFGTSSAARERRGAATLRKLHPRYDATIAALMRSDPLANVRARITPERATDRLRIVHVVHGWPPFQRGGTELYAYWLAMRQRERFRVSVYARGADPSRADGEVVEWMDGGVRVRFRTNHFSARDPLRRNAIRDRALERDFERFLREERPDLVHVHHLAGHTFALVRAAKRLRIPIVMQLQDWWFVCARVNLLHRGVQRCSGPSPGKCAACATLTRVPLANRLVHLARRRAARAALRAADAFVAGSDAIRADYADVVPRATPFHVIPYGIAMPASPQPRPPQELPIRFGYLGAIAPHKGVHVAVEAVRGIAGATLELHGDASAFPDYARSLHADLAGTFDEEDKPRVFASMDVLLVPSIGLESFGLAAREAMAAGVPVIASEGGALSEMNAGALVPPGDVSAWRAIVAQLAADPSIVDRWRAALPRPKSADAHAAEIEDVYRTVLR